MPTIVFLQENEPVARVDVRARENLLAAARRAGVALDAPCDGRGSCGCCRMRIVAGKVEASKSFLLDGADEATGWRLACLCRVAGDATVETSYL